MIYGRDVSLWQGLVTAATALVGAVLVLVFNQPLTAEFAATLAGIDGLAFAIIGLLANKSSSGSYFGRSG